jgi:hypothetical protein
VRAVATGADKLKLQGETASFSQDQVLRLGLLKEKNKKE